MSYRIELTSARGQNILPSAKKEGSLVRIGWALWARAELADKG